jgi:hypothetical protein
VATQLDVSQSCVAGLRSLSDEPVLLKQSADGLRVQIETKPLVPVAIFSGKQAADSLKEAAAAVGERYGPIWTVIVSEAGDDSLLVRRLV